MHVKIMLGMLARELLPVFAYTGMIYSNIL